jgi:hypothetical protein
MVWPMWRRVTVAFMWAHKVDFLLIVERVA